VIRTREHTDTFRDGPVYTVSVNSSDFDVGPEYSFTNTAGWYSTEWSDVSTYLYLITKQNSL
jgi:hypothetical protein